MYDSFSNMNEQLMGVVHGVYVGVVTNNNDPEKLGRVKVKIPVIDDANALDWARVTTMMAGGKRGMFFVPEVGDEVLIAFQMGDIAQPIVIGSLWNSKAKPPHDMDDKNNIRKMTSRAGHQIEFDDTDNAGQIRVKTNKGQHLTLNDKANTIELNDKDGQVTVTIKGGSQVEIKAGTNKITLTKQGDVKIESQKAVTIKSTQVTLEATAALKLKGGASLDLQSDGLVNIKGSMVKIN